MPLAHLSIGTSTDRIDLLALDGWLLASWTPAAGDVEDTFGESALADGRQLQSYRDVNTIETFTLKLVRRSQDAAIRTTQALRRLLRSARSYWTGPADCLVYLTARGACETNTRYAVVHAGRLPEDDNPYSQPFTGWRPGMDKMALVVERGPWLETAPGTPVCVQVSGEQTWAYIQTTATDTPGQSTDDAWMSAPPSGLTTALTYLPLGYRAADGGSMLTGIVFPSVNVPANASIVDAYITLTASNSDDKSKVELAIVAEDTTDAQTFSTADDFHDRLKAVLPVLVKWTEIPAWTADTAYTTPRLSVLVQLLVDQDGWAANNGMCFFIIDNGSSVSPDNAFRRAYAWDDLAGAAPTLTVVYYTPRDFGRDATCTDEVHVANKHVQAQLTDIYYWDASVAAWSANLLTAATPFAFLPPAPLTANDVVLFGINSAIADTGPFSSLVFDIGTALTAGGGITTAWRYSSVGADIVTAPWNALTVTDNTATTNAFDQAGVLSVHWEQPATWAAYNPTVNGGAALGVTGYWVALILTAAAGAPTPPQQANREIYTVVRPSVDVDDVQVPGDMPALMEFKLRNRSGNYYSRAPALYSTRVLTAIRSTARGADYTPFVNLSDRQAPAGITVSVYNDTAFAAAMNAPTGRAAFFDASASAGGHTMINRVLVEFGDAVAAQWYGKFRAYVRGWQVTGGTAGNVGVRLYLQGAGGDWYSPTAYWTALNAYQALDLGTIDLPPGPYTTADGNYGGLGLYIQCQAAADADDCYFTDLILMPVDEWAAELVWPGASYNTGYNGRPGLYSMLLDVDSITYPKVHRRAVIREATTGDISFFWDVRCNHTYAVLLPNADQRLWMFAQRSTILANTTWYAEPEIAHTLQVWRQARYASMRGDR